MTESNGKTNGPARFVGKYVDDLVLALTAAAVSNSHCVLLSRRPGLGKTTITRHVINKMFGNSHVFIRLDASTPPEKVAGVPDIARLIDPKNPEYVLKRDGTAYDPAAKAIILDEIGRPMDPIFDILLDVMDRQDVDARDAPTIIGTSNFMPTSARTEAMRDRIALWVWLTDEQLDPAEVVKNQMRAGWGGLETGNNLPDLATIQRVRDAAPGANAVEAVSNVIAALTKVAQKGLVDEDTHQVKARFTVNPRRWSQWWKVLFYVTVLRTDDPDFSTVHPDALRCLQWLYPLESENDAANWRQIVAGVQDPTAAIKAKIVRDVFTVFRKTAEEVSQGIIKSSDAAERLGRALALAVENARETGVLDDEIQGEIAKLQAELAKVIRGENPFKGGE